MKSMKGYLITMALFLGIALIAGVVVWYLYQVQSARVSTFTQQEVDPVPALIRSTSETSVEAAPTNTEPITLTTEALSPGQRAVLESFGMGDARVVITDATIACAKDAVGEARYEAILSGVAPSPLEAMKLLPCVK